MEYNSRLDKFVMEHRIIFAFFFIPVLIVVVGVMGIGAAVETIQMRRKGYYWNKGWGGYSNPETGDYIKGWT